jgi:transcriptional regulator with XRE-family HTH domain
MSRKAPTRVAVREAFARTVRILRQRAGIVQEQLALAAAIDRGYLGGLERGRHSPTLETVCKIAFTLDLTVAEFAAEFDRQLRHR